MANKLTKHDIAEYYSDPSVQQLIMDQIKNRPVLSVQTHKDRTVYRRNNPNRTPIRISRAENRPNDRNDLAWYTDRRYAEFHPVVGKRTRQAWVDIDPGPDRPLSQVKKDVVEVDNALKALSEMKGTRIVYSGGRGFHVKGELKKRMATDDIRKVVQQAVNKLDIRDSLTNKPPEGGQVRLDTSTLKDQGSLRADYSLNSETGRVAVPLTQRELKGFRPEQASVKRVLTEKEFAPGIRRSRRIYSLPDSAKEKVWTMAVQEHNAKRAGKHWDFRLVDPHTTYAHSWALPKSRIPEPGPAAAAPLI